MHVGRQILQRDSGWTLETWFGIVRIIDPILVLFVQTFDFGVRRISDLADEIAHWERLDLCRDLPLQPIKVVPVFARRNDPHSGDTQHEYFLSH